MAKDKTKIKKIDAPVYGYWQALYLSFFAKSLYVDVGKRWKGLGTLYLLFMVALMAIPFALKTAVDINHSFEQQLIKPLSQLPQIYVQNGEVSTDAALPYTVKDDKGRIVLMIDTARPMKELLLENPFLSTLITKKELFFKLPTPELFQTVNTEGNQGTAFVQPFGEGTNMVFNGKTFASDNALGTLKLASQAMVYPIAVGTIFASLMVILFVLGFLGQVFSRIFFSFDINFRQGIRLLVVAATPMVLLVMSFLTFNRLFAGVGFILMIVLTFYYSYALYALRAESKQMVKL